MWGNKEGWFVSIILALLMGWLMWTFGRLQPTTPPSGDFSSYLTSRIELPVKPEEVRPIFTESRDAGDLYWQAVQEYVANKKTYENFFTPKQAQFSRLDNLATVEPAIKLLLQGTAAKDAKIFIRQPELLVNYRFPYRELDALHQLGRIAGQIGMAYAARGSFGDAEKYYDAEFSLGKKLFDERINSTELSQGQSLMRDAAVLFARAADKQGDAAGKLRYETFDKQTKGWYDTRIDKLNRAVASIGAIDIQRHAGDVIALATESPERMWRVEALLKLGRYKYNAGPAEDPQSFVNQRWIIRYLTEPDRVKKPDLTKDADPAVRLAATLARELTPEGYNQIDFLD